MWKNVEGIIVSVSGGRDSTAALLIAADVGLRIGVPVVAVYADNGFQWPEAWAYIQRVGAQIGVPVLREQTVRPMLNEVVRRGRWPGGTTRYCTAAKRDAVVKAIRRLFPRRPGRPPWQLVLVTGERRDESPRRRHLSHWSTDRRLTGRGTVRVVWRWRPLLAWSSGEVQRYLDKREIPALWVYTVGISRVSCLFCPFAGVRSWRIAAAYNPEMAAKALAVERETGHKLTPGLSLEEVLGRAGDRDRDFSGLFHPAASGNVSGPFTSRLRTVYTAASGNVSGRDENGPNLAPVFEGGL